jgi:hypothetical protein
MQIPIVNGIYTSNEADFRSSYPVNLVPVPLKQGISNGYLRPADGLVEFGDGPGIDRGGINWNGVCYRVMGTKLVSIGLDGVSTTLGDVGSGGQVTLDYSFDLLGISSGGRLYYWDGSTLVQNTDPDLGYVVDFLWVDGYFMPTDGTNLIVTELNDPMSVNPLKYGSSEIDPDPIVGVLKLRDEPYAINRYTIEVFDNIGGSFFPFQRIEGAQIQKGALGTYCACVFANTIAFIGSGRNEAPSVYLGANAQAQKIATREIDKLLSEYTEAELSLVVVESRLGDGFNNLYIHLPDRTIVYDAVASAEFQSPVWFTLTSSIDGFSEYKAKNFVWCYNKWLCGNPTEANHSYMTYDVSSHFEEAVRWEFGTTIIYNDSNGAIFHELELVSLTGRVALGETPQISTAYSLDGEEWSQEFYLSIGSIGNRLQRIVWLQNGFMQNWRVQRFKGDSQAFMSMARLEAQIEPLVY